MTTKRKVQLVVWISLLIILIAFLFSLYVKYIAPNLGTIKYYSILFLCTLWVAFIFYIYYQIRNKVRNKELPKKNEFEEKSKPEEKIEPEEKQ